MILLRILVGVFMGGVERIFLEWVCSVRRDWLSGVFEAIDELYQFGGTKKHTTKIVSGFELRLFVDSTSTLLR